MTYCIGVLLEQGALFAGAERNGMIGSGIQLDRLPADGDADLAVSLRGDGGDDHAHASDQVAASSCVCRTSSPPAGTKIAKKAPQDSRPTTASHARPVPSPRCSRRWRPSRT